MRRTCCEGGRGGVMREGMVEFMMGVGGGGYLELQPQAMLLTHTCARVTCMSHVTRHAYR